MNNPQEKDWADDLKTTGFQYADEALKQGEGELVTIPPQENSISVFLEKNGLEEEHEK